jgi:hypothetical protein
LTHLHVHAGDFETYTIPRGTGIKISAISLNVVFTKSAPTLKRL